MYARITIRVLPLLVWLAVGLSASQPASAAVLEGDLDGDGMLTYVDEMLLATFYGSAEGDPNYEPAADANADGLIDHIDLALFGNAYGTTGGEVDTTPPGLFVTLNDIPDDMNDLLVVPPDGFEVTLGFDSLGGAALKPTSLSVKSNQAMGADPAGAELSSSFTVSQKRATFRIPPGTELDRTSHFLTVTIDDSAGNSARQVYGFGVRDYPISGPPLSPTQTVFLDFGQNRSLGPDIDFLEDLRTFHLSSTTAPSYEVQMRDWVVMELLARANMMFGRNPDGSVAPDSVDLVYVDSAPTDIHSRLCIGGSSQFGSLYLGASQLDVNNINHAQDECGFGSAFGVFPQALDDLWGGDLDYQAAFFPLDPAQGGTPIGEHALDGIVLGASFDPQTATTHELMRWSDISDAVDAFAQAIATAAVHETGHLVGLVAHNPAPAGLYGGTSGNDYDHNVTVGGVTPTNTYVMNQGGSFTFAELTGRAGEPVPGFRPLSWAYLQNELILDSSVTALHPAPTLTSVSPSVLDLSGGAAVVTLNGTNFLATPKIELVEPLDPTPNEALGETLVSPNSMTGILNPLLVQPALYDVELTNPDGQKIVLQGGLLVQ